MGGMQPHQLAEAIQAFAEGNREYVQQSFVGDGVVDKDVRDSRHLLLTHLTRNRTLRAAYACLEKAAVRAVKTHFPGSIRLRHGFPLPVPAPPL